MARRRPELSEYVPILGGLWLIACALIPPHWFGGYFSGINRSLWSLSATIEVFYAIVLATVVQFLSLFTNSPWTKRLSYVAAIAWLFVTVLLFVAGIPAAAGLAACLTFRALVAYWELF